MPFYVLTFAAEIMGEEIKESYKVVEPLLTLTYHESFVVREGAILGLSHYLEAQGVRERLQKMIEEDKSFEVKETAKEVLYDKEEGEEADYSQVM